MDPWGSFCEGGRGTLWLETSCRLIPTAEILKLEMSICHVWLFCPFFYLSSSTLWSSSSWGCIKWKSEMRLHLLNMDVCKRFWLGGGGVTWETGMTWVTCTRHSKLGECFGIKCSETPTPFELGSLRNLIWPIPGTLCDPRLIPLDTWGRLFFSWNPARITGDWARGNVDEC